MLKNLLSLSLISAVALGSSQTASEPIRMVFNDTDVATILRAISTKSGVTIIYANSNKEKTPISLNLRAGSVEQAVKIVAASAGLAYRKAGETLVVASPDAMKQALVPFTYKATYTLESGAAARVAPALQAAFPDATVRTMGDKVVVNALAEDIKEATEFIENFRDQEVKMRPVTEVVTIVVANPADVARLVTSMYANVKATPSGDDNAVGGYVGLSGPAAEVESAKKLVQGVDIQSGTESPNPLTTQVYTLRYTSAPMAEEFLKKVVPEVEVFTGPETFTPPRARFSPLGSFISGGQGGSGGGNQGLSGGGLNTPGGQTGGQGQGAGQVLEKGDRARTIVLKGRRSAIDTALRVLQDVDTKPRQVVVEVNVAEVPQSNVSNVGINWNWSPFDFHELPAGSGVEGNPAGGPWVNYTTRPVGLGQISRAPLNFRGILNALVTKGQAKILAKPSVSVIDNDTASVFVGDTIRVPVTTQGALGAQNVQIEEFPVGIILLIAPRINADGNITLKVNPVISSVTDVINGLPQTSTREAETSLIVKDGETIVLGGLISDEERKTVQEIPLLSKLPLVGELFRNTRKTHNRTELVVSLTTRILKDPEAEGSK
jgi:type II secretory pathway component GspD/PulD (secretin)